MESIEIGAGMEKDGKECDYVVKLVVRTAKPKPGYTDRPQQEIDFEVEKLMAFITTKVKVPVVRHDYVASGDNVVLLKVTAQHQRVLKRAEKLNIRVPLRRDFSGEENPTRKVQIYDNFTIAGYERNLFEPAHTISCSRADNCSCPIFHPSQRLKIIRTLIDDACKKYTKKREKPLPSVDGNSTIFPLHEPTYVRMDFLRRFSGWKTMWDTYFPRKSDEFTSWIRGYFGEKIALYFSFLHFYTRWLFLLSFFGTVVFIIQRAASTDGWWVPIYCVIVAIWAAFLLEFWKRKQNAISFHWDMMDFEETERQLRSFEGVKPERPGFYEEGGQWVDLGGLEGYFRQELQLNDQEIKDLFPKQLKYPEYAVLQGTKTSVASTIIFLLVAGVAAVTVSILYVRLVLQQAIATYGSAIAGCINAITIAIADVIYRRVAYALNDWENYRTATQYEDRLIYKIFFFQFINSYFSLFYIAFFKAQQWPLFDKLDACQPDCMTELEVQLTTLLLTRLVIGNLTEFGIPYMTKLLKERSRQKNADQTSENGFVLDLAEKEASLVPYSSNEAVSGTFDDYAELVIQFGYVTLFAPAFPLAPLIAVLSNIVETSTDAGKLLMATQRPEPHGTEDMGTFFRLFQALSYISVMTNMGIVYGTSTTLETFVDGLFDDGLAHPVTRFVIVVVIEHIILGLKLMIDDLINDRPGWLRVEIARAEMKLKLEVELRELRQTQLEEERDPQSTRGSVDDGKFE